MSPDPTPPLSFQGKLFVMWGRLKALFNHLHKDFLSLFSNLPESCQRILRRHPWKFAIGTSLVLLTGYGYYAFTSEPTPEIITETVRRGDLLQTVEGVGEITSDRALNLQFPVSGVVERVLVKEGDLIEANQKLAQLRAGNLSAGMQSALASLQAAQADLVELQEGARPEDIAVSEAQLSAARGTLTAAEAKLAIQKLEAAVSLQGRIEYGTSVARAQIVLARTAIGVFDDVMADLGVIDAYQRNAPGKEKLLRANRNEAEAIITTFERGAFAFADPVKALQALRKVREAIAGVYAILESLSADISSFPISGGYTNAVREARKAAVAGQKSSMQGALVNIDTLLKESQDATAGYNTEIAAEEKIVISAKGDILDLEATIRTQRAKLDLKKAGSRTTDLQAAAAKVRQAQADYDRARASFGDTILSAPTRGFVTKVNIKEGELLSTAFEQNAAITMLGESPYRVEMYVSEVDVPKIVLTQTGSIELDAFPGRPFALVLAEADPAATDIDGVPKYRVKLDFPVAEPGFKIGMTGDVDIITGRAIGVLMVPARAVYEDDFGDTHVRVLLRSGALEERRVEIGLEGENDVEIVKGLTEGETIIVLMKQ